MNCLLEIYNLQKSVILYKFTNQCLDFSCVGHSTIAATLKVPKREIFVTELFTLSDPIWIGDMRTEPKKPFV